ncbi:MAG TPA: WxcM-like domain-containing protein, partial [Segetibacter sp.]
DGTSEKRIQLNRSYYGVYIPRMIWRSLENFSTNSLALLVADTSYNASDYIRDIDEFKFLRSA